MLHHVTPQSAPLKYVFLRLKGCIVLSVSTETTSFNELRFERADWQIFVKSLSILRKNLLASLDWLLIFCLILSDFLINNLCVSGSLRLHSVSVSWNALSWSVESSVSSTTVPFHVLCSAMLLLALLSADLLTTSVKKEYFFRGTLIFVKA